MADKYQQKFQTTHTQSEGLSSNDIRAIVVDQQDRVWTGTTKGLCLFDGKTWTQILAVDDISTLFIDRGGEIWIGASTRLLNVSGETVFQASDDIQIITEDSQGQVWMATQNQLCCRVGDSWQCFNGPEAGHIRSLAVDDELRVWIATAAGLIRCDSDGERFYTEKNSKLPSSDVRCLIIDSKGHLWIGTNQGISIFDGRGQCHQIDGQNGGLPCENVYRIAFGPQGERWIATGIGAALWQNGKWEYYASRRWLPNDLVTAIGIQQDGTAWLGTPDGISQIQKRPYSLEAKTKHFESRIQARHNRHGFVTSCFLEEPGDLNTYVHEASDNDGLWTALYIAAESFRYAVTGEVEAKELGKKSLKALMNLEEKTSIDGFPARSIIKKDEKVIKSHGEWHDTPDGLWEWKGDTSSDEVDGHIFAYSVYYDLVADEAEKRQIAQVVDRIMTYIVDNDFLLIDLDGEPTRWGVWSPRYLNGAWKLQQGLNSLEILAYLKTAYHITQKEKFQKAYLTLVHEHHYALNMIEQKLMPPNPVNHSDDELAFISYYPLLKYETDPDLRAIYLLSLERSWRYERSERCPLWNFIYGVLTGNPCDVEASLETLRLIPIDLICWSVQNSHRADIEIGTDADRHDRTQSIEVLPPDERRMMRWNGNPFQLDSARAGTEEDDGTFFLLPYWLGRYHGLI